MTSAGVVWVGGHMLKQYLDGDGAIQARVSGFVDLAHAARAEGGVDLVGAKGGAWGERHLLIVVRAEVAALVARLPTAQRQDQRPPIAWVPPQTRRPR